MGANSSRDKDSTLIGIHEEIQHLKSLQAALTNKQHADTLGDIILRLERKTNFNYEQQDNAQVTTADNFNPYKRQKNVAIPTSNVKRRKLKVQIMNPSQSESSRAFVKALMLTLKQKVNGIECKSTDANTVPDDKEPLIVVCPNVSRLQPDVDAAIEYVQRSSPYVVIILHIGSERDLPALPSGRKLKGYNGVTFVDVGCNDQGELIPCEHNKEAENLFSSYFETFNK